MRHEQLRAYLRASFIAVVLASTLRIGVAQAYVVDGPSMEPTVFQHERLIVARCAYGLSLPFVAEAALRWAVPSVGDVVVLESPFDGEDLVKRVIGLPGDVVEIRAGVPYRNGVAFESEDAGACPAERQSELDPSCRLYRERAARTGASWLTSRSVLEREWMEPVRVPEGHVFVMGDHRDRSNDSRRFGAVSLGRLRGRVLGVE